MSSRSLARRDASWVNTAPAGRAQNVKAATGMGVVHMTHEPPLESFRQSPQQLMKKFLKAYRVTWFYKAESAISFDVANLDRKLTLADGTEVELPDKKIPFEQLNPIEKCRRLLDQPNSEQTWRQFIEKTQIRADMAGNAIWYLDEIDEVTKCPTQLWNVNPARMWPYTKGNKVAGWVMDRDERGGGTPFQADEIAHLAYGSADDQVWGVGVVEAVLYEWEVSQLMSKHITDVLSLGGRLAGMITPKERSLTEDEFQDTLRAWRAIENSGNAARRLLVFPEPMDWTRGSATPQEIGLPGLSEINRTNILSAFPVSEFRLGVAQSSGINSGDTRKHMFKEYWEFTIHPRAAVLEEFIQKYVVDPYAIAAGEELTLEIREPMRDDAPSMLEKAAAFRALLNLGFDPESIIPAVGLDRIKWDPELLEQMIMQAFLGATEAAGQGGAAQQIPGMGADQHVNGGVNGTRSPSKQARNNAGNTRSGSNALSQQKGIRLPNPLMAGDVGQRIMVNDANRKDNVTVSQVLTTQRKAARTPGPGGREVLPSIQGRATGSLNSFFTEQRDRIIGNLKSKWPKTKAARKAFPEDEYWVEEIEDAALKKSIKEFIASASIAALQNVADDMERILDSRATSAAMQASWELAAMDITKINTATRNAIRELLEEGGKRGYSVNQIVDGVIDEGFTGLQDLLISNGNAAWGDARAEAIARTELNEAYNRSNLLGYQALGVREVEASDGDLDEDCRDRDGRVYPIEEALTIRDHPNGTLDWIPQEPVHNKATPDVPTMPFYQVLETTPPNINVTSPNVNVTTPDIHVNAEPAQVIFQPGAFEIHMPPQRAVRKIVERDKDNRVTGITEVPDGPES